METQERQHNSEFINPPLDGLGLDTNMLTKPELDELGYKERRKRSNEAVAKKCTDCKRPVSNPITYYKLHGMEILEEGESVHQGCLNKRVEAILQLVKSLKPEN